MTSPDTPKYEVTTSRNFTTWLANQKTSLAFSTYQSGKLFFVGHKPDGRPSMFERTFNRCMGLWAKDDTLWLASAFQIWRMQNVLSDGEVTDGYDRLYVPRVGYVTGDVDVHDIGIDDQNRVVFISTLFSCLGTVSDEYNFEPLWLPPFVSKLAAEDRCHLNGLAFENGKPRYVTACGKTDIVDGWRDCRDSGGCVVDIESNEVILEGLSMPHSPRLYKDKLWLLDSGRGYLGYLDKDTGKFQDVAFCPGYARGLAFIGDFAIVGVSKCRGDRTFEGLPLEQELAKRNATERCGIQVIDLNNGDVVQWLRIEGVAQELYDVVTIPNAARPKAYGFKTDEIRYNVWVEHEGQPMQWTGYQKDDAS